MQTRRNQLWNRKMANVPTAAKKYPIGCFTDVFAALQRIVWLATIPGLEKIAPNAA
jgi:hypothetical protein